MFRITQIFTSPTWRLGLVTGLLALNAVLAEVSFGQGPARVKVTDNPTPKLNPQRDPTQPNPELWGLLEGENEQALEAMVRRLTLLKSLRDLMGGGNTAAANGVPRLGPPGDPQPQAQNMGNSFPNLRVCGRIHGKDANADSAAIVEVNEKTRIIVRPGQEYPLPGWSAGEPLSMYIVSLHNHHVEVEIRPFKRKMILP